MTVFADSVMWSSRYKDYILRMKSDFGMWNALQLKQIELFYQNLVCERNLTISLFDYYYLLLNYTRWLAAIRNTKLQLFRNLLKMILIKFSFKRNV